MFFKLSSFYFFFYITIGIYIIYLPKILDNLKYSALQIGIIFSVVPLIRFLLPFLFLKKIKLNDKVFSIALFISLLSSVLIFLTINNYYLLLFSNLLAGAGMTIMYPYLEKMTMDVLKERYGKSRLYGSLGFIFISLMGALFTEDYKIILYFYIIATLVYVLISITILYEQKRDSSEDKNSRKDGVKLNFKKKKGFWISVFLVQISFGAYYNFFTIYESKHGIDMSIISYLWSFSVICEVLILFFQDYILKLNLIKIIKFSILITVLRWFLLFILPSNIYISFLSQGLHSVSFALYYSATILYLYQVYNNNRTVAMLFLSGISYGLGGLIGSLLAGIIYGQYLFLYSAVIAFFGFLSLYLDNEKK